MRILRITLNNIASLSGTHTVDFTRDPLRSAGLFSISGATGAGKSTLLDALCLSLYDATPRLNQVGRLAELANGEKQGDPRNLLRRGAGEGFTEVAFVGVDGQMWTSRWSVRRSRRSADGALQNVDMTLYRGHIAPGGEGTIAEGGKKTLVLKSIEEKIGLTFAQFTRAVLLAQNDFATFLKADDKERAEILQALTGTAHFESISKAVFVRCANEKMVLEKLQNKLEGNAPFSEEARAAAESGDVLASEQLTAAELRLKELESHVDWFQKRAAFLQEKSKADEALSAAIATRNEAEFRRQELARTEEAARDARPLHAAQILATESLDNAVMAHEAAMTNCATLEAELAEIIVKHQNAGEAKRLILEEQAASQPILKKARELDAHLFFLQSGYAKSEESLKSANESLKHVLEKREATIAARNGSILEQQALELKRERLKGFVPFVADAAKWLDRLDGASAAKKQVSESQATLQKLSREFDDADSALRLIESSRSELEATYQTASNSLNLAIEAEKLFNADQLATERLQHETTQRIVTRLHQQLRDAQSLRDRVSSSTLELDRLSTEQLYETTTLKQLRDVELPEAEKQCEIHAAALELLQAAVSDYAKKLRLALQNEKECPVCGSTHHPYSEQVPDVEATAVKSAKKGLKDLEKKRTDLQTQIARLEAGIEARTSQIANQQAEQQAVREELSRIAYDDANHPTVSAILSQPEEGHLVLAEERLLSIRTVLKKIATEEQKARDAQKQTEACRTIVETARAELNQLQQRVTELAKQHGVLKEKCENATRILTQADERLSECRELLKDLWSGIPSAKLEFEDDAAAFRATFDASTAECRHIEEHIAEAVSAIQAADAAIKPLQESVFAAQKTVDHWAADFKQISEERAQHVILRSQLLDGQSVEVAEANLATRLATASQASEEITNAKIDADKKLAMAKVDVDSKAVAVTLSKSKLTDAQLALTHWLTNFCSRSSHEISVPELHAMLSRDDAWIKSERATLDAVDHAVKSAEGACKVHEEQLQKHLSVQPTPEEESVVRAAKERQQEDYARAKAEAQAARAVIVSDDDRRKANLNLIQEIKAQDALADPWRKLNDLIGSADGAKFRMIAQRRTLDLLLRYANHQLNHLAMRYRLERLPESLNLIVVDRDMGDERRSIHSLSGGESFLVSLALALGLASLTSNRLRIESLFIDEGFGSLDPETLNTAMSALMHLEAQGRKVGVISHVTEMTDAILVQIKVVKGRGGASRILVPGSVSDEFQEPQSALSTENSSADEVRITPAEIASRILAILQRAHAAGKSKVSTKAIRDEIGCDAQSLKAAQVDLGTKIFADGRSLRLDEG